MKIWKNTVKNGVAAERDLRENYERLGFPSPEELQRQIEQSRLERAELAERLRAENIERERLNIERQRAQNEARSLNYKAQTEHYSTGERNAFFSYGYAPTGFYNFPNFGFPNYFPKHPFHRGNFYRNNYHRNYNDIPRVEYRNNLPVIIPPAPRIILAPRTNGGGRN
jgi:hypothetical protein